MKLYLWSDSISAASALELVKLWKKYGIDLLLPIFESFYTQTKDVPFEQQFRIAFAFDIPEMKVPTNFVCICSEKCNLQSNSHIETVSECISEYPQQSVAECTRWQFGVGERVPRQGRQLDCWTLSQTMATSMGLAY